MNVLSVHHNGKYISCQVMFVAKMFCSNSSNCHNGNVITKPLLQINIPIYEYEEFKLTTY
jgi:hypothetical protein